MLPGSQEYEELLAPMEGAALPLVDAWRLKNDIKHAPTAGLHGYAWPEKPDTYDYFFVTDDLAPRVTSMEVLSETAASDHQPIVLELS